jgi:hypothetical protein
LTCSDFLIGGVSNVPSSPLADDSLVDSSPILEGQ